MLHILIKRPEVWKPVTYPTVKDNSYMISNHGRVYSIKKEKILKPAIKTTYRDNGECRSYLEVVLKKSDIVNKQRQYVDILIHRLVAWEFVNNPKPGVFNFVHHINNDSFENYYENLEWTDNQNNQIDARDNGFHNPRKGDNHPNVVYNSQIVTEICEMIYNTNDNSDYIIKYILNKYKYLNFKYTNLISLINHLQKGDRHKDIVKKYKKSSTTILK